MEITSYQFRHLCRFRKAFRPAIATLDRRGEKLLVAAQPCGFAVAPNFQTFVAHP